MNDNYIVKNDVLSVTVGLDKKILIMECDSSTLFFWIKKLSPLNISIDDYMDEIEQAEIDMENKTLLIHLSNETQIDIVYSDMDIVE